MIRINLLPTATAKKRRGPQRTIGIIGLCLVLEVIGLYLWYQAVEDDAVLQEQAAVQQEKRVQQLEERKAQLDKLEEAKVELARQNVIFEKMKFEKTGPPEMLKFLSYVLTKKEENPYSREELKAQEAAGWASGWATDNLWLTELSEEGGHLTLKGRAKSHEDVAEFYRRLETGIYFPLIDPIVQQVVQDDEFKELELVAFETYALVNYNPDGQMKMAKEDVPEELLGLIPAAPEPAPEEKGDGKGGKGKGKGKPKAKEGDKPEEKGEGGA